MKEYQFYHVDVFRDLIEVLKELENTIFNARERIGDLEYRLFSELRDECAQHAEEIQRTADAIINLLK